MPEIKPIGKTKKNLAKYNELLNTFLPHLYFVFLCVYFVTTANYIIIYQSELKLFFFEKYYLLRYFDHPGGFLDFLSGFLQQFYFYFWIGVLITCSLNIGFYYLSKSIFKKIMPDKNYALLGFIPAILLFVLQNYQSFLPSGSLGLIIITIFILLYLNLQPKLNIYSLPFSLCIIVLLYFLSGSYTWIFIAMISIYEILYGTKTMKLLIPLFSIITGTSISWLAYKYFYPIPPDKIFTQMLPIYNDDKSAAIAITLFFIMAAIPLIAVTVKKIKTIILTQPFVPQLLIIILIGLVAFISKNEKLKNQVLIRHFTLKGEYEKVLDFSENSSSKNMLVSFGTNLALAKEGILLDAMFDYFQGFGINGLMLYGDKKPLSDMLKSKLNYELGYINEAHHWAFESLVQSGETSDALFMLAKTNIINKHPKIADKYLKLLEKTLFYSDSAKFLKKLIENNADGENNDEIKEKRKFLTDTDQFADLLEERNLEFLLKNHPDNRIAFEYLQACRMIKLQVPQIIKEIHEFKLMNYNELPKTIQEVCVIYWASTGKKPDLAGYNLSKPVMDRFIDYAKLVGAFRQSSDKNIIYEQIKSAYGNTFWFYADFTTANQ
ncbi:MAG: DUF6057 family protein [Bacteroidales bacterium]